MLCALLEPWVACSNYFISAVQKPPWPWPSTVQYTAPLVLVFMVAMTPKGTPRELPCNHGDRGLRWHRLFYSDVKLSAIGVSAAFDGVIRIPFTTCGPGTDQALHQLTIMTYVLSSAQCSGWWSTPWRLATQHYSAAMGVPLCLCLSLHVIAVHLYFSGLKYWTLRAPHWSCLEPVFAILLP